MTLGALKNGTVAAIGLHRKRPNENRRPALIGEGKPHMDHRAQYDTRWDPNDGDEVSVVPLFTMKIPLRFTSATICKRSVRMKRISRELDSLWLSIR